MDWITSVKEIIKANNENRLVIFVGSGVSKNSNIPDWNGLIKAIAQTIDYREKCKKCKSKNEECPQGDCTKIYDFSREEYLRIPEYYFQSVDDKDKYYQTIIDAIKCDAKSNEIDEIIFEILPQHIITTNYDTLLEDSRSINTSMYKVIYKDEDLLSNTNDRYLIKMHGDINAPETLVLKESDYIDYEQTHTLMSTFIRSLLINSSFLFLGYSLNDNNLNLIIGWINYYCKKYGITQRPHNFLIQNTVASQFEQLRLEKNNIHVISIEEIPDDISCPDTITDNDGKRLFRYLKCISDSNTFSKYVPLNELLYEKYLPLSSYRKISQSDLLSSYKLGRYQRLGNELFFFDEKEYQSLISVFSEENSNIVCAFNKANIVRIHLQDGDHPSKRTFDIPQLLTTPLFNSYFQMYLDNQYYELSEAFESMPTAEKIYYGKLLNKECNIEQLIELEADETAKDDFIGSLIHRVRARLATLSFGNHQDQLTTEINTIIDKATPFYKKAIGFIDRLNHSMAEDEKKMKDLLEKHQERYSNVNTWYSGNSFEKIWEMQSFVYDYFEFFTINLLPINYYSDPVNYFSSYVEAILCSYSPTKENSGSWFGVTDRRPYPLNEIDLDILIKYADTKSLQNSIKHYGVKELYFEDVDIVKKFVQFCNSSKSIIIPHWSRLFNNFAVVISLCKFDKQQEKTVYSAFASFFTERGNDIPTYIQDASLAIKLIVEQYSNKGYDDIDTQIIHILLMNNIRRVFLERNAGTYSRLLFLLKAHISRDDQQAIIKEINDESTIKEKCKKLNFYRFLVPIQEYSNFLKSNIAEMPAQELFDFLIEHTIPYESSISDILANKVKQLAEGKKPGVTTYPDYLAWNIENCIILHLCEYPIDLSKIAFAKEYSEFLAFVIDPQNFDYTKVDLDNYMWQNLIYSEKYQHFFIEHKNLILSDKLNALISNGLASNDTQKIVYGLLAEKQELRRFGN